jgi:hypothetical protein
MAARKRKKHKTKRGQIGLSYTHFKYGRKNFYHEGSKGTKWRGSGAA